MSALVFFSGVCEVNNHLLSHFLQLKKKHTDQNSRFLHLTRNDQLHLTLRHCQKSSVSGDEPNRFGYSQLYPMQKSSGGHNAYRKGKFTADSIILAMLISM